MELDSPVYQNYGMESFGGLENSTFSGSFGSCLLPEKFLDIDFALCNKIKKNPKIYAEVSHRNPKNILVFSPVSKSHQVEEDIDFILETHFKNYEKMTSNFSGNEDLFLWNNDFKMGNGKCIGSQKTDDQTKGNENVNFENASDVSGGKRKFWDCSDFATKAESVEHERKKLKKAEYKEEECRPVNKTKEAGGSKMPPWHVDVIEDMAADLDGSLSNLGADLATGSYNMSEALLSLPSLTVFKQEAPSPLQENLINLPSLPQSVEDGQDQSSTLHRLLQQNNFHSHLKRSNSSAQSKSTEVNEKKNEYCRFQYVLAAATSIATKVTEETLTYLNQGQSYEIKLKKVGELSNFRGKILKSIIRICFHERRLQYMEKEQILAWQAFRPGERLIELDVPLSYGLFDVEQDPNNLNMLSFLWDPTKEVGAYIKVNCISTEFTPKKHGGEKGVPFRIQVETYIEGETTRLHAAACQIKVFKLKGADRKHKQDREKILKRPLSEQDKYQPSYECTVLSDLPPEAVFPAPGSVASPTSTAPIRTNYTVVEGSDSGLVSHTHLRPPLTSPGKIDSNILPDSGSEKRRSPNPPPPEVSTGTLLLSQESNSQQTAQWLRLNNFGNYVNTFANFNGADILRLTKDDLIRICGLADGIRLLNALHSKAILTLYISNPNSAAFGAYYAVYLNNVNRNEMSRKLAALVGIQQNQIHDVFLQGPNDIRIVVTDEVVSHIEDESIFSIELLKDESRGRFILLLKPAASSA